MSEINLLPVEIKTPWYQRSFADAFMIVAAMALILIHGLHISVGLALIAIVLLSVYSKIHYRMYRLTSGKTYLRE